MKKILLILLVLIIPVNSFSQGTVELDMSNKEYKKIAKKLDLKILNRGYDGSGLIWVKVDNYDADKPNNYTKFWNEALFEMDMPTGRITESNDSMITIDADWIFQIEGSITANGYGMGMVVGGGFSGKILDFSDNSKVIATFSTKEKMNFTSGMDDGLKRSTKFKNFVKVVVNEILLTIK